MPNIVLSSKSIYNIRRSGPQNETIILQIDTLTSYSTIKELKEILQQYLEQEETREFFPNLDINISEIIDNHCLRLNINLEHKKNWQDGLAKNARKTRFMWKLNETLHFLNIKLAKPL